MMEEEVDAQLVTADDAEAVSQRSKEEDQFRFKGTERK